MIKKFLLLCVVLLPFVDIATAAQYAYQVNFSNKNGTLPLSDSATFLSARSLARRAKQGIVLDITDQPVTKAYIDSTLTLTGGKLHCVSKWLNLCVILVNDTSQIHTLDGISFISSKKLVASYAGTLHKSADDEGEEEIITASPAQRTTSTDATYYAQTWNQTLMVNGNYLHNQGYKGNGKLIAIVDAGYRGTDTHSGFDSLRASGRILDTHNFTLDNNNIYAFDDHGTEILSTMAGYKPDTFVGSAPLASYALYVTEDGNSEQPIELLNMLSAAERADSIGVDIISSSLGYNVFDDGSYDFHYATDFDGKTTIAAKAANMATAKGMLFVTSAGNEGAGSWRYILTPGDADSALTVGNVDIAGNNPSNSGYGPNAAGRVKPDVCTLGQPGGVFNGSGGYKYVNGTSIATPEIAGWAACLWQSVPFATPAQLRKAIVMCASKYTTPGPQIGYGIPDFRCAINNLNVAIPITNTYNLVIVVPNPVKNALDVTVTLKAAEEVNFRLTDVTGKELMQFNGYFYAGKNAAVSYNISTLPNGLYFLKATTSTHQQVVKLIKE